MILSPKELSIYDGKNGSPMYLSIFGQVFDVTEGRRFYESGPYNNFIGRDGTRAFATGEFNSTGAREDVNGLSPDKLDEIQQWVEKFHKKYPFIGFLEGLYFDKSGNPTQPTLAVQKAIFDFRQDQNSNLVWKTDFLVNQKNLKQYRFFHSTLPSLEPDEILVKVEKFGLTANNITYATLGKAYRYFDFFPSQDGWGVIPVWAMATVVSSRHSKVPVSKRIYGSSALAHVFSYFPFSTHAILKPFSFSGGSFYVKRDHLPADRKVYNQYYLSESDPFYKSIHEDEMLIYRPLFFTSFFLEDYLSAHKLFGANYVLILSGSSKTAIGLAFLLHKNNIRVAALTSKSNLEYVTKLGYYEDVYSYDDANKLNPTDPVLVVDMASNTVVLNKLHSHLQDNIKKVISVGKTHWEDKEKSNIPRNKTQVFFAPEWIKKRQEELGYALVEKMKVGWNACLQNANKWSNVKYGWGIEQIGSVYSSLVNGEVDPETAWIVSLTNKSKL